MEKATELFAKAKKVYSEVKSVGLQALAAGFLGIYLWGFHGLPMAAGICFGVFLTRNWDIISKFVSDNTGVEV